LKNSDKSAGLLDMLINELISLKHAQINQMSNNTTQNNNKTPNEENVFKFSPLPFRKAEPNYEDASALKSEPSLKLTSPNYPRRLSSSKYKSNKQTSQISNVIQESKHEE
jgi:hypothetical protein